MKSIILRKETKKSIDEIICEVLMDEPKYQWSLCEGIISWRLCRGTQYWLLLDNVMMSPIPF